MYRHHLYPDAKRIYVYFEPQQTLLKTEEIDAIQNFLAFRMNAENLRSEYNQKFIREDLQQRTAIITDEDNNLIIAGAGSGKTTTIVGKVKYIIDRYKAKPEEFLLISFTPIFFGNPLCR